MDNQIHCYNHINSNFDKYRSNQEFWEINSTKNLFTENFVKQDVLIPG